MLWGHSGKNVRENNLLGPEAPQILFSLLGVFTRECGFFCSSTPQQTPSRWIVLIHLILFFEKFFYMFLSFW